MGTPMGMKRTTKKTGLKKAPQTSKSKLKKKVWNAFSIYIRLRDCLRTTGTLERGKYITCDKEFPFESLQAGHFIPGRHNAVLFNERHVSAQCPRCNGMLQGNTLPYRRKIIELYGEGADLELEEEARQIVKYSVKDLEELLAYYKNEAEKLRNKEMV